ncbi:hypothetical protein B0H63DRAFT_529729 [Podospora didyma]|uniref:MHYT domain-containing protein n=1 Tax=Podospora didyma TaxID=330526 RepID=A0AAE0K0Y2_9PEZI|nr:hypothetical protein B0H63DRAFT_529729 [Podospora didyma]
MFDEYALPGTDTARYLGHIVPIKINVGVSCVGFIVSLIRTVSALELMSRRKGLYNHSLLIGAALSLGGVQLYVTERALIVADGEPELQIRFSILCTPICFFLPITVFIAAFYIVSIGNENNPTRSWKWRLVFAAGLAGAGVGTFWCMVTGTMLQVAVLGSPTINLTLATPYILLSCLIAVACVIILGIVICKSRARVLYARRAQRLSLAAAVFDNKGQILGDSRRLAPKREDLAYQRHNDVFSTAHPLFHRAFQASWNWNFIEKVLDKMSQHLGSLPHHDSQLRAGVTLVDDDGRVVNNYGIIFRELYCLAAAALTGQVHENLDKAAGYGTVSSPQGRNLQALRISGLTRTILTGNLWLRRALVSALEAQGFRFADVDQVAPSIASTMQIRTPGLGEKLRSMVNYVEPATLDPRVHLGLFAIKARMDRLGFDILVRENARGLLPTTKLP